MDKSDQNDRQSGCEPNTESQSEKLVMQKAVSPRKNTDYKKTEHMSVEEKRKAIQAEKLRKQQEMAALEAEEEALLGAAQGGEENSEGGVAVGGMDDENEGDSTDRHENDNDGDDEMIELDADNGGESEDEDAESHIPPSEGGLAGLDDEEEEFDDVEEASNQVEHEAEGSQSNKKRAISPVTWDVDVHANDNISDDSPIHSDAEESGNEVEEDNQNEEGEANSDEKSASRSKEEKQCKSSSNKTSITEAEALRPRVHKYLYREAKYFMVKSSNHENVRLAKAKGVWSTPPQNEIRFNKAVDENTTVILIFSVKESGAFQGFARIKALSKKDGPKINWVLPPGISAKALSGVFELDWISRIELPFTSTMHLRNPWNLNKPVKIARDGQELQPRVGEDLCKLFTLDGSCDYERVISRIKRKRESLLAKGPIKKNNTRPTETHQFESRSRIRASGFRDGPSSRGGGIRSSSSYGRAQSSQHRNGAYGSGYQNGGANYYPQGPGGRSSYDYNRGPSHRSGYSQTHQVYNSGYPNNIKDIFVKGSYEEYLHEISRVGYMPDPRSMPMMDTYGMYPYHPQGPAGRERPPPPPIPNHPSSRDRDRNKDKHRDRHVPSDRYERDVEDFLRRTSGSSSSRYRSGERYKESSSNYRRERSRSRERYRDRR